jgi:peptidoglycan/LPS O-acetylase OafA/YrhL
MRTSESEQHRPQLDGLRFIAFVGVFVAHVDTAFKWSGTGGVRLFFALSGFLITRILVSNEGSSYRRNLGVFYARRALRIFPIYYAVLLVYYAAGQLESPGWQFLYITNIYMFKFNHFPWRIAHFWSLAVEEQFYLGFPLFLFAVPRRFRAVAIVAVLAACKLATVAIVLKTGPRIGLMMLPVTAVSPILLGCLAGLWELKKGARPWYLWLGIALLALSFACDRFVVALPLRALYVDVANAAFVLVVLGLWSSSDRVSRALAWRPVAYLGKISYGLYVYHMAGIEWARGIAGDAPLPMGVVAFALTVFVSALSWRLFESPILQLKSWFPYDRSMVNGHSSLVRGGRARSEKQSSPEAWAPGLLPMTSD